jgi:NADPH:quinone reductase
VKALRISKFADNLENLETEEVPDPEIGPGQAKVRVLAASINPSDVKNVQGKFPKTQLPRIPGRDFAGMVVEGPANLIGTEVWGSGGDIGFTRDGSHAEFLMIPVEAVVAKPRNLSFEEAACVGVNFLTAYQGLFRVAKLQPGETLLVTGAQGGVGSAVLQLGQTQKAKLIAVDRKPLDEEKFARLDLLGYVNISEVNLLDAVEHITKGQGVDVAFDCVGGELFEPVLSTLRQLGRQVAITSVGTRRVSLDLLDFYHRRLTLLSVDSLAITVTDGASLLASMAPLFEAGSLKPSAIAERGWLDEAKKLYSYVAAGHPGKAVFSGAK